MSVIAATITADASVNELSNDLAKTLYVHETERTGSMSSAEISNYLNFVGDWNKWVEGLTIATETETTDGSATIIDVAEGSNEGTVFSWTDVSNFASSASLYDVRFKTETSSVHGTIDIKDFITISASNIRETDLHFTVGKVTNTVTTDDISGAGTVNLTTTVKCNYHNHEDPKPTTVSTNVVYACPGGTVQVVKEDNILAADKITFNTDNSGAPAQDANDVLYAEYSPAEDATETVTGSVTAMTLADATLTDAIQSLLSGEADLADLNELDDVKNTLRTYNQAGAAPDTFKGFTDSANKVNLDFVVNLGGSSETLTASLVPQIFFNQYETNATDVIEAQ